MKTLFSILTLIILCFSQQLNIIVKTNTYEGQMSSKHAMAIWIQNEKGTLVKPLLICAPDYNLKNWRTVIEQKDTNSYKGLIRPTVKDHDQSIQASWDCKNLQDNPVTSGKYCLCIEFTENSYSWEDTNETYTGKFLKKTILIDSCDKIIMEDDSHISFKATYISPDLISPRNNATKIDKTIDLLWKKNSQVTSYDCQVSTNSDFSIPVETYNISDTFYTLKNLKPSTKYFWRIKYLNEWSEKRCFYTSLKVPTLLCPVNDTLEIRLRYGLIKKVGTMTAKLIWKTVPCSFYDCQISVNAGFSSPVANYSVKDTSLINDNLDLNTKYYWRVRAITENDTSNWSESWSFITVSKLNIKIYDMEGRAIYSYSDLDFKQPEAHIIKKTKNLIKNLYLIYNE